MLSFIWRAYSCLFPFVTLTNNLSLSSVDWLDSLIKSIPTRADDDDDSINEEMTEMTDSIIMEARLVAIDVLNGMRTAAVVHATEAQELQTIFDAAASTSLISK